MIESVQIRNFKGLRAVDCDFERLTVLVGPNASGKTSILQALHLFCRVRQEEVESLFLRVGGRQLLHARGGPGDLEIVVRLGNQMFKVRVFVKKQPNSGLVWHHEALTLRRNEDSLWVSLGDAAGSKDLIPPSILLRLDTRRLAAPSVSDADQPTIQSDGTGLASALAYLRLNQPDHFDRLQMHYRHIFPFVDKIRFDRAHILQPEKIWGEQVLLDTHGAIGIPAEHASDGFLLVLGLLTAIFGVDQPQLVLMDDLDHGLHPQAQRELVDLLRKLLEEFPHIQIVATTHSPYLLDRLRPEEVRLTARDRDGEVHCARLDSHPDFAHWKEAMSPGEFWSMVREKWIVEPQTQEAPA